MLRKREMAKPTLHSLQNGSSCRTISLDGNTKNADTAEPELSSDFLQFLSVTENTGLYRAQVAVEGGTPQLGNHAKTTTEKPIDPAKLKALKCGEFSVKTPEDNTVVNITGMLVFADTIVVSDYYNFALKLFDQKGKFLSSVHTHLKHKHMVYGLTSICSNIFVSCDVADDKVRLWTLHDKTIVCEDTAYDVVYPSYGIHYDGAYYVLLHSDHNSTTVLDTQGMQIRKIVIREVFGKKIKLSWGIHIGNATHNIYVSCEPYNSGVLCISVEGDPLWFSSLAGDTMGITSIQGVLCVAKMKERSAILLNKSGEFMGQLLEKDMFKDSPICVHYDESSQILFIAYDWKCVIRQFHTSDFYFRQTLDADT